MVGGTFILHCSNAFRTRETGIFACFKAKREHFGWFLDGMPRFAPWRCRNAA
jgi:hypothetical protein